MSHHAQLVKHFIYKFWNFLTKLWAGTVLTYLYISQAHGNTEHATKMINLVQWIGFHLVILIFEMEYQVV